MTRPEPVSTHQPSFKERFQIGGSLIPPVALLWIGSRIGWVPISSKLLLIAMPCAVVIGMLLPGIFSGWHRLFSAAQRWLGHRLLKVILGIAFLVTILPIGLWFRARGRSFLDRSRSDSYWAPARRPGRLKNQF
jgi:hypothetical protein